MIGSHSFVRRVLVAAGLAAAVAGTAALGEPAAADQPLEPFILGTITASVSPLKVQPFGTRATVTVTSSEPTALAFDYRPAGRAPPPSQPPRGPLGGVANPFGTAGVATTGDTPPPAAFKTQHQFELKPLKSNTAYDVSVVATMRSGQQLTAQTRFTTLQQRVRVTLREISVEEDGDWFGNGEPVWSVYLTWAERPSSSPTRPDGGTTRGGSAFGCYPNTNVGFGGVCQPGSVSEGRIFPRNNHGQFLSWTFAEENFGTMPEVFTIRAEAEESDWIPGVATVAELFEDCLVDNFGCSFTVPVSVPPWQVPQGQEFASTPVRVSATDSGTGFRSVVAFTFELFHDNLSYPATRRNVPSSTW